MYREAAAVCPLDVTISTTLASSHHNISFERDPNQKKKTIFFNVM